jgi:hypothetical protein
VRRESSPGWSPLERECSKKDPEPSSPLWVSVVGPKGPEEVMLIILTSLSWSLPEREQEIGQVRSQERRWGGAGEASTESSQIAWNSVEERRQSAASWDVGGRRPRNTAEIWVLGEMCLLGRESGRSSLGSKCLNY